MQNTIPTMIRKRFCGPPNSGNGGYVCGLLAKAMNEPCQVTLHAPPPLDTDLVIVRVADGARLLQGETLLGSARPYQFALTPPPAVTGSRHRPPTVSGPSARMTFSICSAAQTP